jgi:uncharacterized SAM-binding protein YcdF (DUF218 family)
MASVPLKISYTFTFLLTGSSLWLSLWHIQMASIISVVLLLKKIWLFSLVLIEHKHYDMWQSEHQDY